MSHRKWLTSVRGEHIAFTGKAWRGRAELRRIVRRLGGIPTLEDVTETTTVLVRGESTAWAYGKFGIKEKRAAQLLRRGYDICLVHDFEFRRLIERKGRARISDYVAGEPVQWLQHVGRSEFERCAEIEGTLDREYSVKGRVEQSYLRSVLFGDAEDADCGICGRSLPIAFMIAAHIKPRSDCSRKERLDARNIVVGLCTLGCDALYERGLIAVDAGSVVTSTTFDSKALRTVLKSLKGKRCATWSRGKASYFDWHLKRRFQG